MDEEPEVTSVGRPSYEPLREGSVVAMGSRRAFAERMRELVERDRAQVTEQLAAENASADFVDAILWGVRQRPPDRTCMNLRAQIMKSVDEERKVVHEFWLRLGVSDEAEAARLVSMAKSV